MPEPLRLTPDAERLTAADPPALLLVLLLALRLSVRGAPPEPAAAAGGLVASAALAAALGCRGELSAARRGLIVAAARVAEALVVRPSPEPLLAGAPLVAGPSPPEVEVVRPSPEAVLAGPAGLALAASSPRDDRGALSEASRGLRVEEPPLEAAAGLGLTGAGLATSFTAASLAGAAGAGAAVGFSSAAAVGAADEQYGYLLHEKSGRRSPSCYTGAGKVQAH